MRLPTRAPARLVSPARGLFALSLALVATLGVVAPRATSASHYVVDLNGGGDFTTIQAAIDAQFAVYRDTILVMPGVYAETVALPQAPAPQARVIAVGGASVTSMNSLTAPNDFNASSIRSYNFEGFTFSQPVSLVKQHQSRARFAHCVFEQGLSSVPTGSASTAIVSDCDFLGRTRLESCYGVWSLLRFHHAPLTITHASGAGSFLLRDCTFEGPADTLVFVPWANYDYGGFDRCTFTNAHHGLVYGKDCINIAMPITACVFLDLDGLAVAMLDSTAGSSSAIHARVDVSDSRFERCGTAVHWVHGWGNDINGFHGATLLRDTVLASTGDGVVLGPQTGGGIFDTIVDGSGGCGAHFTQSTSAYSELNPANATVSNSRFTNNGADGLRIEDTVPVTWTHYPYAPVGYIGPSVAGSVFTGNAGAGLRVTAARWDVHDCVAYANVGDGFALTNTSPAFAPRTVSNTSVLNLGDGFRLAVPGAARDSVHLAQRNLAAMNTRAGIRVPALGVGSLAFNDAYQNYLGQYVGPASPSDSSLTVDPRFCDLSAGLAGLGLQEGSPCGPSGVYGLIGARPEECANVTAVPSPLPAGALAFAVRPSVARGSVEFVVPAGVGEGRVEVFDLAGSVVWRAPLGGATATVRWNGDGERGRTRAGIYWVRFTRGAVSATRRLVWLE